MGLDPYQVIPPYLAAEPFEDIDYFDPIKDFASKQLVSLAKSTIYRMQRMAAVGIFEDTMKPLKSVWDEWCWYQANYDNDCGSLSDAFEQTLNGIVSCSVSELGHEEAVLISCAVCVDHQSMPGRSNDDISHAVRDVVTEAASRRSLSRFEGW
ncbi:MULTISPECIES: hypothetical protein [unclassified Halomonas]|uniref:hypothetical protein n=1 Tax=unclassified Halomonas TaxID=2609666 RepID=UPI004033FBF9